MKIIKRMKKYDDNRGSAMLVAIIASLVVIGFSLSLLLVGYTLYSSSTQNIMQTESSELAKSVSLELEKEITVNFEDYAKQSEVALHSNNSLWFYLRNNIGQTDLTMGCPFYWPYYQENIANDSCYRTFNLKVDGGDSNEYKGIADYIKVTFSWERPTGVYWEQAVPGSVWYVPDKNNYGEYYSDLDGIVLKVVVSCKKADSVSNVTSYYKLSITDYDISNELIKIENEFTNPYECEINNSERWVWKKIK